MPKPSRLANSGGPPIVIWSPTLARSSMLVRPYLSMVSLLQVMVSLSSAADGSSTVSLAGSSDLISVTCALVSLASDFASVR